MTNKTLEERLIGFLDLELQGRKWILNYEEENNDTATAIIFHNSLTKEQVLRHIHYISGALKEERFTVVEQPPTSDDQSKSQEEPPH